MAAAMLDASLLALLAVVTAADLRYRLIPDRALLAAASLALALVLATEPGSLPVRLGAATGAGGFLLVAAVLRPEGMGLGDVKLAAVLGLYLGEAVVAALVVAFLAGSVAGVVLMARHGWEARSRTIPFAPFLAVGALASGVAGLSPQP
jgi:leader peptidase (prepilin peptidase) / N-methyltransferase